MSFLKRKPRRGAKDRVTGTNSVVRACEAKRIQAVVKKCIELSYAFNCQVALHVFTRDDRLVSYASDGNPVSLIQKFISLAQSPHESYCNDDYESLGGNNPAAPPAKRQCPTLDLTSPLQPAHPMDFAPDPMAYPACSHPGTPMTHPGTPLTAIPELPQPQGGPECLPPAGMAAKPDEPLPSLPSPGPTPPLENAYEVGWTPKLEEQEIVPLVTDPLGPGTALSSIPLDGLDLNSPALSDYRSGLTPGLRMAFPFSHGLTPPISILTPFLHTPSPPLSCCVFPLQSAKLEEAPVGEGGAEGPKPEDALGGEPLATDNHQISSELPPPAPEPVPAAAAASVDALKADPGAKGPCWPTSLEPPAPAPLGAMAQAPSDAGTSPSTPMSVSPYSPGLQGPQIASRPRKKKKKELFLDVPSLETRKPVTLVQGPHDHPRAPAPTS